MDPESPTEPPPPAYDAQEFDRKVSVALDMSMDPALQTVEEEWEEWNEDRFNEAARRQPFESNHHYSSSTSTTHPISRQNSKKSYRAPSPNPLGQSSSSATGSRSRRLPSSPHSKERPSWYTEAHLHFPARSDNIVPPEQTRSPPLRQHEIPMDDDEFDDFDEPLPPFASVGPSLEGPPFEEIAPYYPPRAPVLNSPPRPSYQSSVTPAAQRNRPANRPAYRSHPMASPPLSSSNVHSSGYHPPPMPFAYTRQRQITSFRSRDDDSGPVDPALLYNSAVTSVMKKTKAMQPLRKPASNRDRSNDANDRRSFDTQSTRSYAETITSYQGSSHIPRVAQYAIPSLPTLPTHYMPQQSLPSANYPTSLPTLPTLPVNDSGSHQTDPRNTHMYYTHSNASQW